MKFTPYVTITPDQVDADIKIMDIELCISKVFIEAHTPMRISTEAHTPVRISTKARLTGLKQQLKYQQQRLISQQP